MTVPAARSALGRKINACGPDALQVVLADQFAHASVRAAGPLAGGRLCLCASVYLAPISGHIPSPGLVLPPPTFLLCYRLLHVKEHATGLN